MEINSDESMTFFQIRTIIKRAFNKPQQNHKPLFRLAILDALFYAHRPLNR